jgi:antitoxin component YwqK of YwqJK toxin-antitoxin module
MSSQLRDILANSNYSDTEKLNKISSMYQNTNKEQPANTDIDILKNYSLKHDPQFATWLSAKTPATNSEPFHNGRCPFAIKKVPSVVQLLEPTDVNKFDTDCKGQAVQSYRSLSDGTTILEIYRQNGLPSKITINQPDGTVTNTWYFENGQTSRIESFKPGHLRQGSFRSWYLNGNLQFDGEYENDVQKVGTTMCRYNSNGTFNFQCMMFENGQRVRNNYNDKNEVISSITTVNDVKDGAYFEYKNGKIMVQAIYKNGKLNGQHIKYDYETQMVIINWYLDDVCIGPTLYRPLEVIN